MYNCAPCVPLYAFITSDLLLPMVHTYVVASLGVQHLSGTKHKEV